MPLPPHRALTGGEEGRSHVLVSRVIVSAAFDRSTPQPPELAKNSKQFNAIWDTGATNSVITQEVVDECQLKPTGMVEVTTAQGSHRTETYLVSLLLPNSVGVAELRVSKGVLTSNVQVLIGMDIIGAGDFAVSNVGGKTVFSFRSPSVERSDFVKQLNSQNQQQIA